MHNSILSIFQRRIQAVQLKLRLGLVHMGFGSTPDFLIIGAAKSGTTSLYNYIKDYSKNFVSPIKKELYYFTEQYHRGNFYYKSLFPLFLKENQITGEATPDYLFYHKCAARIHVMLPNVKLIVLLRDPIERAYSHYNFIKFSSKTSAKETLSFDQAVKEEELRCKIPGDSEYTYAYKYYSYKKKGHYYEQLKNWFQYFPREQFLIIDSHDLLIKPEEILKQTFNFIGAELKDNINFSQKLYNKQKYPPMNEKTRKYLADYYKPTNQKLYRFLDRNFRWDN